MGAKSRRKSAQFEREVVNLCKAAGINAERRAGLQANPLLDEGDVYAEGFGKIECKRRARAFGLIYSALENADCAVIRDDRRAPLVVFQFSEFLSRGRHDSAG